MLDRIIADGAQPQGITNGAVYLGDGEGLQKTEDLHMGLGELAMGQLEKAQATVGRTDAMAKEVLYAMGCVAEDMGQRDQALGHFSTILEQDIGFRDVAQKVHELKESPSS